jgi:hypothetical protein
MTDRLVTHAANGIDVHFGTDHDHIADYRSMLAPLGLEGVLRSVVSTEVSPTPRGHFNVYPIEEVPDAPMHGGYRWWDIFVDTTTLLSNLKALGNDPVVQVNHPLDGGMWQYASIDIAQGDVRIPDHYAENFEAVEVLNHHDYEENLAYFLSLTARGLMATPIGSSDSHTHWHDVGSAMTYFQLHVDDVADYNDDLLRIAIAAHATVASTGPYLDVTVDGAWAPGQTYVGPRTVEVSVWSPSWMPIETVTLYRDGQAAETFAAKGSGPRWAEGSFQLDPEDDAIYVITASSVARAKTVYAGLEPWALASPIRIDVAGDGWDAPLPPLVLSE